MLKTLTGYHYAHVNYIPIYFPPEGQIERMARTLGRASIFLSGTSHEEKLGYCRGIDTGWEQYFTATHWWYVHDWKEFDLSFIEDEKYFLNKIARIIGLEEEQVGKKYYVPHRFSDDFLTKIGADMTCVSRNIKEVTTGIPFQYLGRRIVLDASSRNDDIEEMSGWLVWRRLQEE